MQSRRFLSSPCHHIKHMTSTELNSMQSPVSIASSHTCAHMRTPFLSSAIFSSCLCARSEPQSETGHKRSFANTHTRIHLGCSIAHHMWARASAGSPSSSLAWVRFCGHETTLTSDEESRCCCTVQAIAASPFRKEESSESPSHCKRWPD